MQRDLSQMILVVKLLQVCWVQLLVVLKDKANLLEVLLKQQPVILWENVVLVQHIVIPFNVKQIVVHNIIVLVEVLFYHKGHVAETKINHISEDDPVSCLWLRSVAIQEIELWVGPIIVWKLNMVAFDLAPTHAVGDMVSIHDEQVTILVLKGHRIFVNVKIVHLWPLRHIPVD